MRKFLGSFRTLILAAWKFCARLFGLREDYPEIYKNGWDRPDPDDNR